MSLESSIDNLTAAITKLIEVTTAQKASTAVAPAAPVAAAPIPSPALVPPPAAPAAPTMPALPTFAAPAAPPAQVAAVPFSDNKGLIDYVMATYKALGPQKGAAIQSVLVGLGYQNINDVKVEHYAALYAGVEALKAG